MSGHKAWWGSARKRPTRLRLAGVQLDRDQVEWLALNVDEPTATVLASALERRESVVNLDLDDRNQILATLNAAPADLAVLRARLVQDLQA